MLFLLSYLSKMAATGDRQGTTINTSTKTKTSL